MKDRKMLLRSFGNLMRKRREYVGITQIRLAELVGCSLQAIGNIERGQANPSLIMVYRIALALDVSVKDILP